MISMRRFVGRRGAAARRSRRRGRSLVARARVSSSQGLHRDARERYPAALVRSGVLVVAIRRVARLALTHSWTHPEGWRAWPYETPATTVKVTGGKVPIPERCVAGFALFATRDTAKTRAKGAPMAVSHLQCKECKAEYPLEALYVCERCFGPLEVAYDHSGLEPRRRRAAPAHPGRSAEHLALRRLPAARRRPSRARRAGWPRASGCPRAARR